MVTLYASGALGWIEPLVALASTAATVVVAVLILFIGAPGLALLAGARPDGRIRNAPYLWLLPSIACTAILVHALSASEEFLSWTALFAVPYVAWATLIGFGGLVHALVHAGRFLISPDKPLPVWEVTATKLIYGIAAILVGGLLLIGAVVKGTLPMMLYAVVVVAIGVVIFRTDLERKTNRWATTSMRRRFGRLVGAVALAVLVPFNIAWTAKIISSTTAEDIVTAAVFVVIPWLVAFGAGLLFHKTGPADGHPVEAEIAFST